MVLQSLLARFVSRPATPPAEITFPELPIGGMAVLTGNCPAELVGHRVIKLKAPRLCESKTAVYDLDNPKMIPWRGNQGVYRCRLVAWELSAAGA